jgi:hypothetical protein
MSFQQDRYRIFNTVVSKESYYQILKTIRNIIPNPNNLKLEDFWKTITSDQIIELSRIPEFNKNGFEYITGLTVPKIDSDVEKAIQLLTDKGLLKDGKVLV